MNRFTHPRVQGTELPLVGLDEPAALDIVKTSRAKRCLDEANRV
jgi:hypothetical protein